MRDSVQVFTIYCGAGKRLPQFAFVLEGRYIALLLSSRQTNSVSIPSMDGESPAAEVERLRSENQSLRDELARRDYRQSQVRDAAYQAFGWLGWLFLGRNIKDATVDLAHATQDWQVGKSQIAPLAEVAQLAGAALRRFIRVGIIGLLLALIPLVFVCLQTWALFTQNSILERQEEISNKQNGIAETQTTIATQQLTLLGEQNSSIERQTAQAAFEQATRFSNLFKESAVSVRNYGFKPGMAERFKNIYLPNDSTVEMVSALATNNRGYIVAALAPLLSDRDGRVSAGAILSIRNILRDSSEADLVTVLPILKRYSSARLGNQRSVSLIGIQLTDEDLTPLKKTNLLQNAFSSYSRFDNVNFSGIHFNQFTPSNCNFFLCNFDNTTWRSSHAHESSFSYCSFDNADFQQAHFHATAFERSTKANLGDITVPTTMFKTAKLNDAFFGECQFESIDVGITDVMKGSFHTCGFFGEMPADWEQNGEGVFKVGEVTKGIVEKEPSDEWKKAFEDRGIEEYFKNLKSTEPVAE